MKAFFSPGTSKYSKEGYLHFGMVFSLQSFGSSRTKTLIKTEYVKVIIRNMHVFTSTMKPSATELTRRIVNASQIAPEGGLFHHYKGGTYKVIDLAINANTQNVMVVYIPITGPYFKFVRPVEEWSEMRDAVKDNYRKIDAAKAGRHYTVEKVPRFRRFEFDGYPSYDNFHD